MKRPTSFLDQLVIFVGVGVAVHLLFTAQYGAGAAVSFIVLLQASAVLSRVLRGPSRSDVDAIVQRQLELDERISRNMADNARLIESMVALAAHTGWAASWCPVCGDCSCPRHENGERLEDDPRSEHCPLHGFRSKHAQWDELAEPAAADRADDGANERAPSEAATPPAPPSASEQKERES